MMTEGEVVSELVEYSQVLLIGMSVVFTVVSAYVVGLNYFIGAADLPARLLAFFFITIILAILGFMMLRGETTQIGLIERLRELEQEGGLSAAGRAALANAAPDPRFPAFLGDFRTIDSVIHILVYVGFVLVYITLTHLTFVHRWRPEMLSETLHRRRNEA